MLTGVRVYDPVLRALHWINAVLISLLLAGGLAALFIDPGQTSAWLHKWHGLLGGALLVGLSARLAWALTGPAHARLADMWQPQVWRSVRYKPALLFSAPSRYGHHPVASLAYLALYTLLLLLATSGLILLATHQGAGPLSVWLGWQAALAAWPDTLHTLAAWCVLTFVGLHLAALVLHPRLHRTPVAQAMINGIQYLPAKNQ